MMPRFPLLSAAVAVLALTGCASSPLSPKGDAIYNALEADTRMRVWADNCSDISVRAQKIADTAMDAWWRRNGSLVESADYGLAWDMVQVTGDRQHTGARLAMALTWGVVEKAEAEVSQALNDNPDRETTCMKQLNRFKVGEFDIADQKDTYQQLLELQHQKDMMGESLLLKQAALQRQTNKEYGRSFYVVEKVAKRQACPGASVSLLSNNWPDEVYLATCDNADPMIFRCEWGNCRILD